ncbi:MAG: response regulator [Clostridia bacterium]
MRTVMIVDDAGFTRTFLRNIIESIGMVVVEAKSGEEAIALFRHYVPDLIMMDISMPGMDGLTTAKKIMEIKTDAEIIVCSARGQRDTVFRAISSGVRDYIIKPLQRERVELAVQKILTKDVGWELAAVNRVEAYRQAKRN